MRSNIERVDRRVQRHKDRASAHESRDRVERGSDCHSLAAVAYGLVTGDAEPPVEFVVGQTAPYVDPT
eukprot:56272-Eustigmatos_ZCMA.PRE.1